MKIKPTELTAESLKNDLWSTLKRIKSGQVSPSKGAAIAMQAREILRTVRTQVVILSAASQGMTDELIRFADPKKSR